MLTEECNHLFFCNCEVVKISVLLLMVVDTILIDYQHFAEWYPPLQEEIFKTPHCISTLSKSQISTPGAIAPGTILLAVPIFRYQYHIA